MIASRITNGWRIPLSNGELVKAQRANVFFDAHGADAEFGYSFLANGASDDGLVIAR